MVAYETPSVDSTEWSNGDHPLWKYLGALPRGITIYKDGGVWYVLDEGYEERNESFNLHNFLHFLGGREYDIDQALFDELVNAGFGPPGVPPPPGQGLFYPGPQAHPSATLYPHTG